MVHTALRAVRRSWPASLSPGWRVERLIGPVMMVAALPTARSDAVTGAAWVSLGVGLACWLVFVRLAPYGATGWTRHLHKVEIGVEIQMEIGVEIGVESWVEIRAPGSPLRAVRRGPCGGNAGGGRPVRR